MTHVAEPPVVFADYGEVLRRRWPLILVAVVIGTGAAMGFLNVVPKTYDAAAQVQVKTVGEDGAVANGRTSTSLNLDTEAQLVTSNAVALRAKRLMDSALSAEELADRAHVTVPPNTSVLTISFTGDSPTEAQRGAQAFADAYLMDREETAQNDLDATISTVQGQIDDLRDELVDVNRKIAQSDEGTVSRAAAEEQRAALTGQIRALNEQLTPLLGENINPGEVITRASLPEAASNPSSILIVLSGLLGGLLLGCLLAVVVDRSDRRIRERRDVERLGLGVLTGVVPLVSREDLSVPVVRSSGAESLRQLRNALLAQLPDRSGSVIVTNVSDTRGGSAVSVSLAVAIARSGTDVALLSANTAQCAVEQAFELPVQPGLIDVLRARVDLAEALFDVPEIPHLSVMPAGADGSLTSDLLQTSRIEAVLAELAEVADVVLIDVAPTSANADAQTLASASQGVLLVATAHKSKREQVLEAVDQFTRVSAPILGAAVVSVSRRHQHQAPAPSLRMPSRTVADGKHSGSEQLSESRVVAVSRSGTR